MEHIDRSVLRESTKLDKTLNWHLKKKNIQMTNASTLHYSSEKFKLKPHEISLYTNQNPKIKNTDNIKCW